jgi:fimbrial chaperone protein
MYRFATATLLSMWALLWIAEAGAGSLRVGPTLIELDQTHPVAVVRVTNNNAVRTAIDARATAWQQSDNSDDYTATTQLIVRPAVFELEPGESQVVRIGLAPSNDSKPATELAYRVYVSELPVAKDSTDALQFLMRIGIPVFVNGKGLAPKLLWKVVATDSEHWRLTATNSGAAHAHLLAITVRSGDQVVTELGSGYLLPGTSRSWEVNSSGSLESFNLIVKFDNRSQPIRYRIVAGVGMEAIPDPLPK